MGLNLICLVASGLIIIFVSALLLQNKMFRSAASSLPLDHNHSQFLSTPLIRLAALAVTDLSQMSTDLSPHLGGLHQRDEHEDDTQIGTIHQHCVSFQPQQSSCRV